MVLSMNNCNFMSNRNHFKDIGTFLSKIDQNPLDDPQNSEIFYAKFYRIFWSKPEVSIFDKAYRPNAHILIHYTSNIT